MAQEYSNQNSKKVLAADADSAVLQALKDQLQDLGFHITTVDTDTMATEHLKSEMYGVVLVDHDLGGAAGGIKLLELAKEMQPDSSRLLLASGVGVDEMTKIVTKGLVFRYLTKPWMTNDMKVAALNAAERYSLRKEIEAQQNRIDTLTEKVQIAEQAVSEINSSREVETDASDGSGAGDAPAPRISVSYSEDDENIALTAMNRMLYTFHPNLGNTALRAKALCATITDTMGLSSEEGRILSLAAQTHDVGLMSCEIGMVRRWMRSPAKCSIEEMEIIKKHSEIAEETLLSLNEAYAPVAEIVRHHHENWDGTGYPDKLKGETIPKLSRLLGPVIYYCNQNMADMALIREMETELADRVFDPDAVRALVQAVPLTRMPRGEREILLIELKAGMELARPIVNTNNMKLVDAGLVLEEKHVNKVHSINNMTPINPLCLVFC
jgi:response regulator RpfG family c-di-GMP phosphodiesterase